MALFIAYNNLLSTTTGIQAGQSLTGSTAAVTLQLGIPSNGYIDLVEWGISFNGTTTGQTNNAGALCEVAFCSGTATTLTAHTTATVMPYDMAAVNGALTTRLTLSTTTTAYGSAAIVTGSTTLLVPDKQYVQQSGQYVKIWPEGRYPRMGNGGAARLVQFRVNPSATVTANVYAIWDEHII